MKTTKREQPQGLKENKQHQNYLLRSVSIKNLPRVCLKYGEERVVQSILL